MAENKTKVTKLSVTAFIAAVADPTRRADARALVKLMKSATGEKPKMWGPSIVGFGSYHYKYESGREGDMPLIGFSPRKTATALYNMADSRFRDAAREAWFRREGLPLYQEARRGGPESAGDAGGEIRWGDEEEARELKGSAYEKRARRSQRPLGVYERRLASEFASYVSSAPVFNSFSIQSADFPLWNCHRTKAKPFIESFHY